MVFGSLCLRYNCPLHPYGRSRDAELIVRGTDSWKCRFDTYLLPDFAEAMPSVDKDVK